jgi:hypothetical protein
MRPTRSQQEFLLDQSLEETFPASDSITMQQFVSGKRFDEERASQDWKIANGALKTRIAPAGQNL